MIDLLCSLSALLCRRLFIAVFLLPLLALPACEIKEPDQARSGAITPEAQKTGKVRFEKTRLTKIPADYDKWGGIFFSTDGRQVLYRAAIKEGQFFVTASPGHEKKGHIYERVSWLIMSCDLQRFAFGGKRGAVNYLVIDHKELKNLDQEEIAPASFSPDGRYVVAEAGGFTQKKWFIVVSNGEREIYRSPIYPDTLRRSFFSPDSRLLVYELGDDKSKIKNRKSAVFFLEVASGKIIKKHEYTDYQTGFISFSPDSSRVIYDISKDGKFWLVTCDFTLNQEKRTEIPYAVRGPIAISSDGKHIAFAATKKEKVYLVVSSWESPDRGKETGPYEEVTPPVFSPGSGTAACLAFKKGKWRSLVGGREGEKYDEVADVPLVFSRDGSKIAYSARKNDKWVMIVSNVNNPDQTREGPPYDMVVTPVFSPDSTHIAYRARTGPSADNKRFIVIASAETGRVIKEGPVSEEIWPPVWSDGGNAVGYGLRIGRELWWEVAKLR